MTIPMIKATYTLDADTVKMLESLARRWNTSKSEAIRRAIRAAAVEATPKSGDHALAAFDRLQDALALTERAAAAWARRARAERRASSRRRGV